MSEPDTDDHALATEVADWIAQHWDPDATVVDWWRLVADAGWTAPHFPAEWGGRGLPRRAQSVVHNAFHRARALAPPGGLGLLMAAPTIRTHGTPEQIDRYVAPILRGEVAWCQLFSEPGAGSDLAGLSTRALPDGDKWRVTGQKVWSSQAMEADFGMLIARTNVDVPKHAGISWFALALDQPGVTIRPLRESTGHAHFNEVFFDDAVVDHSDLVGGEGNGWAITQTTLMFERAGIGAGGAMVGFPPAGPKGGFLDLRAGDAAGVAPPESNYKVLTFDELVALARERDRNHDPHVRQALARLAADRLTGEWTAKRARHEIERGRGAGLANISKLVQSRIMKGSVAIGMDLLGADGLLWQPDGLRGGRYSEALVFSTASSIYGGTDQIQRNIIGERALGLPREPKQEERTQ